MNFAKTIKTECNTTTTDNGAFAVKSTNNALVDLFATIGAARNMKPSELRASFDAAYTVSPLSALKILFYARDIRGGAGERDTFRMLLKHAATYYTEAMRKNIHLISEYGRFDDLYALIGTPLEKDMWSVMSAQFKTDLDNMANNKTCSLLAKWIKTPDASSNKTRALGIKTALNLGYTVKDFKRALRKLRAYIRVIERDMSSMTYENIDYSAVPSQAMLKHRNAFKKHDADRFNAYIQACASGKTAIHADTLYPYQLIQPAIKYKYGSYIKIDDVTEAQWNALPNYVNDANILVMADTSGSMETNNAMPLAASVSLALYFAERNKGAYHNLFMTFSSHPSFVSIKGVSLADKLANICEAEWGFSTNINAAFDKILDLAVANNVPSSEMPKALVIISDMQFNEATTHGRQLYYDANREKFEKAGYTMPDIVFWNVNATRNTFHATSDVKGVQMASGYAASTFKAIIENIGTTPYEMMMNVINSERYSMITL